ncbi:MAG: hypothetical protein M3Y84_04870 [Acidobacteriota bacterium]|nr:hypothetical protein [Acidobacteriota bacterium]
MSELQLVSGLGAINPLCKINLTAVSNISALLNAVKLYCQIEERLLILVTQGGTLTISESVDFNFYNNKK